MKTLFGKSIQYSIIFVVLISATFSCGPRWIESERSGIMIVTNKGGQILGYSNESGVKILTVNRYAFKDLNKNEKLDGYEDWRLTSEERAVNLASQMSIE